MYDTDPVRIITLKKWCTVWYTVWTVITIIIGITSEPMNVNEYLVLVDSYSDQFRDLTVSQISSLDMTLTITNNKVNQDTVREAVTDDLNLTNIRQSSGTLDSKILLYLHGITEKSTHFKYALSLIVFLSGLYMSISSQFYINTSVIKHHTCLLILQILHGFFFWSLLYSVCFIEHVMIWSCCLQTLIQIIMVMNASVRDGLPTSYGSHFGA